MSDGGATPTPTGGENGGALVIDGQVTAEDLDELDDDVDEGGPA